MKDHLDVMLEELNKQCGMGEWALEKHDLGKYMLGGDFCYKITPQAEGIWFRHSASRPYPGFVMKRHIYELLGAAACAVGEIIEGEGLS